jgi:WD40-like Beta Propeller Repeat
VRPKSNSLWIALLIFAIIAGASCSVSEERNAVATPLQTSIPTTNTLPSTLWASSTPRFVVYPTNTPLPTLIPYPTAQTVSTNAIAFIANDSGQGGQSSLWVANVDGSGERKLVDITKNKISFYYHDQPQWSPNGKWIAYFSDDELWIISPDGSINKKILSRDDKNAEWIWDYDWSPDSQQIAFIKTGVDNNGVPVGVDFSVSILDLESGMIRMLGEYEYEDINIFMEWAPNGQYIIIPNQMHYYIVEAKSGKVVKVIPSELEIVYGSAGDVHAVTWSPNSQWFSQFSDVGSCGGGSTAVTGLDGKTYAFGIGGANAQSVPVWDETGNYLYSTSRNVSCWGPTVDPNEKLWRFSLNTKKSEPLLSLNGAHPSQLTWSISISLDGHTLETHAGVSENQQSFIILDLNSMSTIKYTVNLGIDYNKSLGGSNTAWSPDNQHIVIYSEEYQPQNYMRLDHGPFYTLDIQTGKTAIISGDHRVTDWAVSPAVANP